MKLNVSLLVPLLALAGCAEPCPHYNRLQVASYYPVTVKKPYGTVKPFHAAQDVGQPYEEIGFMSCEGSADEEAAILNAMLYRAADMGADGILLDTKGMTKEQVAPETQNGNNVDVNVDVRQTMAVNISNPNSQVPDYSIPDWQLHPGQQLGESIARMRERQDRKQAGKYVFRAEAIKFK